MTPVIDVPPVVVECAQPASVIDYAAVAPADAYATLAPVVEDIAPTPSVTYAENAPVDEHIVPAPVVFHAEQPSSKGQPQKRRKMENSQCIIDVPLPQDLEDVSVGTSQACCTIKEREKRHGVSRWIRRLQGPNSRYSPLRESPRT